MSSRPGEKRAFTLKSRRAFLILRVCGVIDLICGVPLFLAGIGVWIAVGVVASGSGGLFELVKVAAICFFGGLMGIWAGLAMIFQQVVVTPRRLITGNTPRILRRCNRDEVVAIDIRQSDFGRMPRAVPFAVLRDGTNIPLMPLATVLSSSAPQLETQRVQVDELRQGLGIGGADLAASDVRWPSAAPGSVRY